MIIGTVLDLLLPVASFLPHSSGPYLALMLIGFAIGILGHLTTLRWLVASGVILIFLGAFLFPVALKVTEESPGQPVEAPHETLQPIEITP
jgi:hypothetical protein